MRPAGDRHLRIQHPEADVLDPGIEPVKTVFSCPRFAEIENTGV
jgi:hypothetical protein